MAAAGLFLAACSEKDEVAQEQFNQYSLIEGQSAWISVGISTPGEPITRANEDLNDGVEAEWKVYSAKLVLFKGASEDEATLIKDYDITTEFQAETGDNTPGGGTAPNNAGEVSHTSKKIVREIEAPALGGQDNLYGYVILNWEGNATGIQYTVGQKFSAFKEQVLKAIGIADESKGFGAIGEKGLVMTNVPVADQPYGESVPATPANVTTLAKIDKAAVYPTKEAATNGTATACIYVERTAVKVEVENKATQVELGDDVKVNVEFNGWALGNVNFGGTAGTGYYNTRQFDTEWLPYANDACATSYLKYRMVGRTKFFNADHETAYRTYFGRDVNYDNNPATNPAAESFNTGLLNAKIAEDGYTLADKAATYTYENTFDENSQIWANTTYVGVKMTLTLPAGQTDFYTIEGQPNTMLNETTLPAEIAKNHSAAVLEARSAIEAAIQADLESNTSTLNAGKEADAKITSVSFDIEPVVTLGERSETDGSVAYTFTLKLTNVKNSINGAAETDMAAADITKLETLAGANLTKVITGTSKVYKYVGGVSYYSVRIAHFGDIETPWSAPAEAYNNYEKIYPRDGKSLAEGTEGETGYVAPVTYGANRANAWLGRWGIVRNNWYKLSIDKIEGLGSPVPEDYSGKAGGTPDDNPGPKYYIQAHIHILPWVVRNQSVKF